MLSRVNSMVWMEGGKGEEETAAWAQNNNNGGGLAENKEGLEMGELSTFKSMLEAEGDDWYMTNPAAAGGGVGGSGASMHVHNDISFSPGFAEAADNSNNNNNQLLLQAVDSSASCSPTPASIFNNQVNYFLQPKSFISGISNNPLEGSFDLGCESGYLESAFNMGGGILSTGGFGDIGTINSSSNIQFGNSSNNNLLQLPQGSGGFGAFGFGETSMQGNSLLFNRSKILKPLDNFASLGTQPTLFQKRAALRKNLGNGTGSSLGSLHLGGGDVNHLSLKSPTSASDGQLYDKRREISEMNERKRKSSSGDDIEDLSMDGSNLNYDSDEQFLENGKLEESGKNGGSSSHANSTVTGGDPKGKKKGLPAKNLMAERRRRKKLNDRLYMLRSVVPKISKMDRASILGDAIEYLKELLQNINDLHNELESIPSSSNSLTPTTTGLYPLTPTAPGLSTRIKEELCPSAFASPLSSPTGQPARVEVRLREGRAVNIHMFCGRRPGLLLSTMRAMDNLGLDVQQAVISCFNGFALDVFRAEQCREGQELNPDQIKAVLLDSAGYHGMV